jgi:hypothetical protein
MSQPIDPMATAVQRTILDAFELATNAPEAALPHIDRMERSYREAAAEAGTDDISSFQSAIHALRFVAYGRLATFDFERNNREPSARIAGNCEMSLRSYRAACELGTVTPEWKLALDGTVNLLELCRPGKAYELLGSIKIKNLVMAGRFYMPDSMIAAAKRGIITRPELDEISDLELRAEAGIIRYAAIKDADGAPAKYLIAYFSNPQAVGAQEPGLLGVKRLEKVAGHWQLLPIR